MGVRSPLFLLFAAVWTTGMVRAADWPGWRGPTGMGRTAEKDLPLTWGGKGNENVLWKVALPGQDAKAGQDQNQSSPVVAGGRVFVTVSYWPGGKPDPKAFPEHHVACYRTADGNQLWDTRVEPGSWLLSDLRGGYTAPTPAVDADRVYVVFGSAVIAALDLDGKILWRKQINPHKFDVALAPSPVLYEDTVILQCDQLDRQSRLVAFDRRTGEEKWEEKRPGTGFGHSTPVLATVGGKPQLLVSASNALQGVDPATGKLLWSCEAKGDTVSPVLGGGIVYCDSGRGGPGVAVDPTGAGDVTKTHLKWKLPQVPDGYSSPVVAGDFLYRLHAPDVVKCIKLSTGEVAYSERLSGVSTASSPVTTADGRVYAASAGKSYILKAGPLPEVLAVNDLGDGGPASPAVAGGRLYLKGRKWLFCVGAK
ncbi:MAG: outer rane biosis protein BamB [Gemmataceae bacterium]|nr:outer rane biosis protein BamB [Gemmataceae bacterium]